MNTSFYYKGYKFIDNNKFKSIHGKNFNLYYNKEDGYTERWGKSRDDKDDPVLCKLGPTIMDIELSRDIKDFELPKYKDELKIEHNTCLGACPMCYKSNSFTKYSHYMSLVKYKYLLMQLCNTHVKVNDKLIFFNDDVEYDGKIIKAINIPDLNWETDICNCSPVLQLAMGITNLTTNPELLQICHFSQQMGITPNITCHGKDKVSDEFLKSLCECCGSIAVSRYDKNKTYDFLERLHYAGCRQTNLHVLVSEETFEDVMETMDDMANDKRLKYLGSLILLFLKQRGRGTDFHRISNDKMNIMFKTALDNNLNFGFDICCSHRFTNFIKKYDNQDLNIPQVYDVCDSSRFSGYVNALGEYCPCSFIEDNGMWLNGPNVFECKNFIDDIWNGPTQEEYRSILMGKNNTCLFYNV
jgi:hypothetical protein